VERLGRKALIKTLIEGGAELVLDESVWRGEMIVSTRNTMYRFTNGVCASVLRGDQESGPSEFLGMRIAGWLVDEASAPRVSPTWRPGASAVLLRPGLLRDALALTSPTLQMRRHPLKGSGAVRLEPPARIAVADSMTRIGVPAQRRRG